MKAKNNILILVFFIIIFQIIDLSAKIYEFNLKNRLKVYLIKKGNLPIVSINVVYRTGCKDEYNGITGIAHMLEHMNFRGSKHFKDGYYEMYVTNHGGVENASTSFDYTRYYTIINKKSLPTILKINANNIQN